MRRLYSALWLCLFVGLVADADAFAQSQATTAEINGRVNDAQGGVLPGATVTARSEATGYARTVATNEEGLFAIPLLPPGSYEVTAELTSFAPATRTLTLTVGATVTINYALQLGGVTEKVTVAGGAQIIETGATIRTTTVDQQAIANLPINGRRFQDFVTLTPTVQVDPQRGQLSFAGQRGINANVSVDGADYNQPFFGGIRGGERSNNAFTVPQESVQEFQVVAAGYSAEFGRSTGGLVNVITKSGTNALRGSGFYLNRNRDWADENAFGQVAAPTQHQFGTSFGGPIAHNRLFFFGAYEQQEFTNTRAVAFNLTGIAAVDNNREAYDYYRSLETDFDATNDAKALLGRVDYQVTGGSRINVRYSHSRNVALNSNAVGGALEATTISALSNNGTEKDQTDTVVGQFTGALRPNLLLEARGQYSREERPREANELSATVQNAVGNYGTVNFLPTTQSDWRVQTAVNLTALAGEHTFKVGTEYNHVYVDQTFGFNQFGRYTVNGSVSSALEVMSVGGPTPNRFQVPGAGGGTTASYLKQIGNLALDLATDELAFFAQDSWKLGTNVTLNYGVRWEGAFNPTPEANNDYLLNALDGFTFPIGRTVDPTQIPDQLNQWGPRAGVAWDVTGDGRTVVRGYTGLYYARTPSLIWTSPMNNYRLPPGDVSVQLPYITPTGPQTLYEQFLLVGIDLNRYALDQLPVLSTEQLSQIASALGLSPNPFAGAQTIATDTEFRNPRATQFGVGAERELLIGLTAGAEFTYVDTDYLQRNREMNLSPPAPRPTDPAQRPFFPAARPLAALGSVQLRESTASSEYRALALTTRLRKGWGLASVNYVLSKSMSDDDNERDSGGTQYENSFDLRSEWGPARLDRRHQFNGYVMFNLPYRFDVSSGFRFLSGRPIDAAMGRDANGDRVPTSGVNAVTDRPFSAPGVPFQRNSFRNEPFKDVNFRAQWRLELQGNRQLIFSADVFNVFNWDNIELGGSGVQNYCAGTAPDDCGFSGPTNPNFLSLVDQNPASATNGQLIRTNNPGAPRQLQFGVRFQF